MNQILSPIRVLVPGTSARYRCGGLSVALQTARLISSLRPVHVVTYRQREADYPYLDDLLRANAANGDQGLWLLSWGFDVPGLVKRLKGRYLAYQAHSSGYGFSLPAGVPIVAVSKNTLGYWGDRAPRNPLFLVPNALESQWLERGERDQESTVRPIDVLVQARKSSNYLSHSLIPALQKRGLNVHVQSGWVDDVVSLFNRAKVYLYDSADYWRCRGVSEGFGLPPLEALACGCVVFSSFNHALSDLLTPGVVAHQLGQASLSNDINRIAAAVVSPQTWQAPSSLLDELLKQSSETVCIERWRVVLRELDHLLPSLLHPTGPADVPLEVESVGRLRRSARAAWMRRNLARVVNRLVG